MTKPTNPDQDKAKLTGIRSTDRSVTFVVLIIAVILLSLLTIALATHRRLYLTFDPQYIINTYLADCHEAIEDIYGEVWMRDSGTQIIVVKSKGDEITCLPVNDEGFGGMHDDGRTLTWHRSGNYYYLFVSYGEVF